MRPLACNNNNSNTLARCTYTRARAYVLLYDYSIMYIMVMYTRKRRYRAVLRVGRPYNNNNNNTGEVCEYFYYKNMWASAILTTAMSLGCYLDGCQTVQNRRAYTAGTCDEKNLFTTRQICSVYNILLYYMKIYVALVVLNLTQSIRVAALAHDYQ